MEVPAPTPLLSRKMKIFALCLEHDFSIKCESLCDTTAFAYKINYPLFDQMLVLVILAHMLKVILLTFVLKGLCYPSDASHSASRLARNKILTTTPLFLGSHLSMVLLVTRPD